VFEIGKWAISTPREATPSTFMLPEPTMIFADLNMEGYPCSKTCSGSQDGRGGAFYGIVNAKLHASFISLISSVCDCGQHELPYPLQTNPVQFTTRRLCSHGCAKRIEEYYTESDLPVLSNTTSSFWQQSPSTLSLS